MAERIISCAIADCDRPVRSRRMCSKHYMAWYKANPDKVTRYGRRDETPLERVIRNIVVNKATGCWEKQGHVSNKGYGQVRIGKKFFLMHRLAYEAVRGPIPVGTELDHLCRNTRCSNPFHLEAVTHRENILRSPITVAGIHSRKTHCIRNHEFTPENTKVVYKKGRPCRSCIACEKVRHVA
jgi:hypothetical protein